MSDQDLLAAIFQSFPPDNVKAASERVPEIHRLIEDSIRSFEKSAASEEGEEKGKKDDDEEEEEEEKSAHLIQPSNRAFAAADRALRYLNKVAGQAVAEESAGVGDTVKRAEVLQCIWGGRVQAAAFADEYSKLAYLESVGVPAEEYIAKYAQGMAADQGAMPPGAMGQQGMMDPAMQQQMMMQQQMAQQQMGQQPGMAGGMAGGGEEMPVEALAEEIMQLSPDARDRLLSLLTVGMDAGMGGGMPGQEAAGMGQPMMGDAPQQMMG